METEFRAVRTGLARLETVRPVGRVVALTSSSLTVAGFGKAAALGDHVRIMSRGAAAGRGEILRLADAHAEILPYGPLSGLSVGDRVLLTGPSLLAPDDSWTGRLIDAFGQPLDGRALAAGPVERPVQMPPPPAAERRALGARLDTGVAALNTLLPLVRGQRLGLFAGSGVGKSTLLAALARGVAADIVVIALIGERGREVRHFVDEVLGEDGMRRAVVVAATSDQSPLARRRCAWTAMSVAEHFRDRGRQVLLLADSVTRFAEAHREIALMLGESASLRGFPPSVTNEITGLAERAGPGSYEDGDITAIFSVLVAGSDMEEPVADILRGVLDGHVVLDRTIAERGRYPAIDLLRSVSRSLPGAASASENALISQARAMISAYEQADLMIKSGLYMAGSDPGLDRAIRCWPALDAFFSITGERSIEESFDRLGRILGGNAAAQPE